MQFFTKFERMIMLCAILLLQAGVSRAESLVSAGYQEAVFSVSSIESYQSFFENVAGWDVLHEGVVDEAQLEAWGLPPAASAVQVVLGNAGTTRGYVRLVQFLGVPQLQIRSNAQSWDTGGWFDVNSRVLNMQQKFQEFQSLGWQANSDPVEFSFGPFIVKEWLSRGPDGIIVALIERVAPALEGWPELRKMSRFFNATQIVPDIEAAREFYIDKLGFSAYLNHEGPSKEAGPNVLGMPYNLATEVPRLVTIVHPQGENEGSVELLQYDGMTGADWSSRAVPPNLGILMLRFPVADIDEFYAHAKTEGLEIAYEPTKTMMAPYGEVRVMALRGPGGAWLEFFEAVDL